MLLKRRRWKAPRRAILLNFLPMAGVPNAVGFLGSLVLAVGESAEELATGGILLSVGVLMLWPNTRLCGDRLLTRWHRVVPWWRSVPIPFVIAAEMVHPDFYYVELVMVDGRRVRVAESASWRRVSVERWKVSLDLLLSAQGQRR